MPYTDQALWEAKNKPCMDCGKEYPPYVMDFDHVRGDKIKGLAAMVSHYGETVLRAEIAKCDVVCSNCHRERTFGKRQKEAQPEFQI